MLRRISKPWAIFNIIAIFIAHIISGLFGIFRAAVGGEEMLTGKYHFLEFYTYYVYYLGIVTLIIAACIVLGVLIKLNLIRLLVICFAWWNLFSAPLIGICYEIYSANVIKSTHYTSNWAIIVLWTFVAFVLTTLPRLYIIYILREDRAGYLFLRT